MADKVQNFKNHARIVPLYHGFTFLLLLATLIGSIVNLVDTMGEGEEGLYSASLLVALCVVILFLFFFCRVFALKAQDRAIRAEENLRHFVLTGKLLDSRLDVYQVIGLRFASDDEFPALADRAAKEGMDQKAIKMAVKNWRTDHHRV